MESWKTEESVDSLGIQLKRRRSLLLMVICILTWVGCGLSFLFNMLSLISTNLVMAFQGVDRYSGAWFILDLLIFPGLCALGAAFMFSLKRWGFWIYLLGQLPPVIISVYGVISLTKSLGPGVFFGLLWNGISIAFIVLYAVEMNKLSRKPISTDF